MNPPRQRQGHGQHHRAERQAAESVVGDVLLSSKWSYIPYMNLWSAQIDPTDKPFPAYPGLPGTRTRGGRRSACPRLMPDQLRATFLSLPRLGRALGQVAMGLRLVEPQESLELPDRSGVSIDPKVHPEIGSVPRGPALSVIDHEGRRFHASPVAALLRTCL